MFKSSHLAHNNEFFSLNEGQRASLSQAWLANSDIPMACFLCYHKLAVNPQGRERERWEGHGLTKGTVEEPKGRSSISVTAPGFAAGKLVTSPASHDLL